MSMQNRSLKVSGFTIVRNARILDYPFEESVLSALPLCDEFIINCGKSDDDTRDICQRLAEQFPNQIRVIHTQWTKTQGGHQLRDQTNRAINECTGDWCVYVQADEAFHQDDYAEIKRAIHLADLRAEVEGILFDYLHFYGGYGYQIQGRSWYRREVRAFKNHPNIQSFRDAQGFRRNGKLLNVIPSHAQVFHYGYVRTPKSMLTKSEQMSQWWDSTADTQAPLINHVGLFPFHGSHPAVMQQRVRSHPGFEPKKCPRKWDKNEIKNLLTLMWEKVIPLRIGEFRNYRLIDSTD